MVTCGYMWLYMAIYGYTVYNHGIYGNIYL